MALFVPSKIGKKLVPPQGGDRWIFSVLEDEKMDPCLMHPELEAESMHLCSQMKYSVSNCRKFI